MKSVRNLEQLKVILLNGIEKMKIWKNIYFWQRNCFWNGCKV